MKCSIFLLTPAFTSCIVCVHAEIVTSINCTGKYAYHMDKDGNQHCCENDESPPGYETLLCKKNYGKPVIKRCDDGFFKDSHTMSEKMKYCDHFRSCTETQIVVQDGNATHDRSCTCDQSKGFCNPNGSNINPIDCKQCPNNATQAKNDVPSSSPEPSKRGSPKPPSDHDSCPPSCWSVVIICYVIVIVIIGLISWNCNWSAGKQSNTIFLH